MAIPPLYRDRVRTLRRRLPAGVDAVLISNPRDIRYLTGFAGSDSWALVRAASDRVHVISDFRFQEEIRRDAPHVALTIRKAGLVPELEALAGRYGIGRLALQEGYVTLGDRKRIAARLGAARLKSWDDGLLEQRSVKSEPEVQCIRQALAIQQEAFRRLLPQLQAGQTELQITAILEFEMKQLGAEETSFPSIVAVDANASLPHAVPGSTPLKRGSMLLIDWGARVQGYCGDLTRVVALGKMAGKIREIYQVVLAAQQAAIAAIAPGKTGVEIDAVARQIIADAGYGKQFGHSLGHGLGLDIHELPVLASRGASPLAVGQVVTVEPGIYLPGIGGVRIEDDVLVTEGGCQVLSDLPKDLESAII